MNRGAIHDLPAHNIVGNQMINYTTYHHADCPEVLRIVHFDRLFHLFDSVDEAAASLVPK